MKSLKFMTIAMLIGLVFAVDGNTVGAAVPGQGAQSGRWVQFTRPATVRTSLGGSKLAVQKVFQPGQWFHVYEKTGNAYWVSGYVCLNGGRFCNKRDNIKGSVLRSVLPSLASIEREAPANDLALPAFSAPSANTVVFQKDVRYVAAFFEPAGAGNLVAQRTVLRVCPGRRPVWVRNDKLHPIGYLTTAGADRFVVDRPSPNGNWMLGWAYGGGVNPNKNYGRVLMSDRNGYKLMCRQ